MLNKLKFIPLILISLVTFSFAVQISLSSSSYDYRFRISAAGDMWLYDGIVDGVVEYCQYTRIENNAYAQPNFNESAFKKDSFYSQSDPTSKSPDGYFDDPATIYKFLGSETYNGSVSFKHETYSWAKKPNSIQKICVQCNIKAGEYFDSTTGLCVNKCEDIANRRDRFNCICKRAGKLGFYDVADHVVGDNSAVCSYTCTTTKDDPEASVGGDGNFYNVSYKIHDTDPNASGVCFTDDNYIHGTNPDKPDKPDNNNTKPGGGSKPDKPDTNNTKPDKPNQGGGGHPGGGSNPGNNNGTKPGNPDNNNGTKPGNDGDKDNPKMDFSGYDKLTKTVSDGVKKVTDMYGDAKNQLQGAYYKIKNGSLSDFKPSGFVASCPYTRDFVIKDGLSKKITIDICAVVKDARSVLYFIFYAIFSTIFSILLFKIIIRLV
jgi:proline-rich receptor-like protein kinase PERK4